MVLAAPRPATEAVEDIPAAPRDAGVVEAPVEVTEGGLKTECAGEGEELALLALFNWGV